MSAAHRAIPPCMSAPGISGQNSTPAMTMYITAVQSFPYQRAEYTFPGALQYTRPERRKAQLADDMQPYQQPRSLCARRSAEHHGNLDELIRRRVERLAEIGHHIEAAGDRAVKHVGHGATAAARPLPARAHL